MPPCNVEMYAQGWPESPADQDDPYTLVVALDSKGCAEGDLYADDGKSFAFERGVFAHRHFRCYCPAEIADKMRDGPGTDNRRSVQHVAT